MKKLLIVIGILVGLGFAGILAGAGVVIYVSYHLPKISSLADYHPATASRILSKDGTVLAKIALENREVVSVEDIPKRIVYAFLSAEDANFYQHQGVDFLGVLRAFVANIKAGHVVQGGSTITQQVAKSLLLSSKRSYIRKLKDFLLAMKIEKKFSKKDILYLYLNQVYLGGGYYGVKTAFRGYFHKELTEATIAESAMIAGLLVAPGKYSPYVRPKYAKMRQAYVLKRMLETKRISQQEYKEALEEKIKFYIRRPDLFKAGYFTDWVRQRVVEKVGEKNFLHGGFEVQTTLDYELQQKAEKFILEGLRQIDKRQGFKGPIGHIELDSPENLDAYVEKFRITKLHKLSNFFTLNADHKREYEFTFDPQEWNLIKQDREEFRKKIKRKYFIAGNSSVDSFITKLEKDKLYKAIVIKVDNWSRLIYVTIGGVRGVIPYRFFRWAHKRVISSDRQYFPYVTRPSTIVSRGDEIWVKIHKLKTSAWRQAESSFRDSLKEYRELDLVKKQRFLLCSLEQDVEVQGALVALNPYSGEVVSFVGGSDFGKSQFNRAIQSSRQPGSSFKPLLYSVALENGYTANSIILDSPEALTGVDNSLNWKPRNYDGKFLGPITLREALEHSRNVPAIKVAQKVGVDKIAAFMERLGLNVELPHDLSVSLGSFGINLLDLTSAYAMFPNGGKLVDAKSILSIVDRYGNKYEIDEHRRLHWKEQQLEAKKAHEDEELSVVTEKLDTTEGGSDDVDQAPNPFLVNLTIDQVYDKRLAYVMTKLLQGVILHGTGRSAKKVSTFLGGKTGTTNKYIDALFLGFSSQVVLGVWTGFDNNQTLGWGETGAKAALPIWTNFIREYIKKYGESDFVQPPGIINVRIDRKTGELEDDISKDTIMEVFVRGTEPGAEKSLVPEKKLDDNQSNIILEDDDYFEN